MLIEFHPLADAFPLMEEAELGELAKDIDANGQRHPVVTFEGKILDGRNRYKACQRLGIKAKLEEFDGSDPVAFVVSENITRRHLTPAQRAIAAEKLATAMHGGYGGQKSKVSVETKGRDTTVGEAAKVMDVSPQTIHRVRQTRKGAVPEVTEAMDAGKISPRAASNLARLPKDEQTKIMAENKIEDVPVIAATVTGVAGEATVGDSVKGPGRGAVGPKVLMTRHMALPDVGMVVKLAEDWDTHKDVIPELDADQVKAFVAHLKKARTATTRLINLIEHGTSAGSPAQAEKLKASGTKGNEVTTARARAAKVAPGTTTARKTAAAKQGPGAQATPAKAPAKRAAKKTTAELNAGVDAAIAGAKARKATAAKPKAADGDATVTPLFKAPVSPATGDTK